jgi:hypothetical protein
MAHGTWLLNQKNQKPELQKKIEHRTLNAQHPTSNVEDARAAQVLAPRVALSHL